MIEQIVVEGDELYVLFESGAYAYRGYAGNVVDRVLKLNLIKWKSLIRKSTKIGLSTYIKCKEVRHIEAQQIENLFAGNIRNLLMDAKLDYDKLYEIRLRVGRPLFLTYDGGECFLRKPGQEQYLVTTEDLKETLEYVTGYSLYAYEDEIRQGFISVQGGHRVGVTGKVVLDRGRIMGMKYISCINVRLAHEIQGCADKVMPYIRTENGLQIH